MDPTIRLSRFSQSPRSRITEAAGGLNQALNQARRLGFGPGSGSESSAAGGLNQARRLGFGPGSGPTNHVAE
uniref:Uncharacterized protein n=1 Tax=Fagus sylvatica TaxID=28930 RepID=A0A2N9GUL1_FAGSY